MLLIASVCGVAPAPWGTWKAADASMRTPQIFKLRKSSRGTVFPSEGTPGSETSMLPASSQQAYPPDAFKTYRADGSNAAGWSGGSMAFDRRAASPLRAFGALEWAFAFNGVMAAGGPAAGVALMAAGGVWTLLLALSAALLLACAVSGMWARQQVTQFQRGELAMVYATALQGPRRKVFDRRQITPSWSESLGMQFGELVETARLAMLGRDKLRRWGMAIKTALEDRRPASEALAATLSEEAHAIAAAMNATRRMEHDIHAELGEFAERAGHAAEATGAMAEEVSAMTEAVRAVTRHAEQAAAEAATLADTTFAAQRGVMAVSEVTAALASAADQVKAVLHRADMLGINAGIEAARAGETGRGFAVVAAEIKALATSGQVALDAMLQVVVGLKSEAAGMRQTIAAMGETVQAQSRVGQALGEAASHQIESIGRIVRQVDIASAEIATVREKASAFEKRDLGVGPASPARQAVERLPAHADAVAKILRDLPQLEDMKE
jgi:hypothetical protein